MHIGPIKFLIMNLPNAKYNLEKRLYKEYTSINWYKNDEIEETIAVDNNKNDNEEDSEEKNRQLKREK